MDYETADTSKQEGEKGACAPLAGRNPNSPDRSHHGDEAEIGRVEHVTSIDSQEELARDHDRGRCYHEAHRARVKQQAE